MNAINPNIYLIINFKPKLCRNEPTQGQEQTLTEVEIEPTSLRLDHYCIADWASQGIRYLESSFACI